MLNLPKPFDEREVRDSECLVYETIESQPVTADFLAFSAGIVPQIIIQRPPLSGPSLLMIPSALSLARCFSTAFGVIPITSESFRAE